MKKDILKEEFEKEIDLPESLSKNNMIKTLKEKGVTPEKKAKVKILPKVLSAAAMFIILIVAVFSVSLRSEFVEIDQPTTQSTSSAVLQNEEQNKEQPTTFSPEENKSEAKMNEIREFAKSL